MAMDSAAIADDSNVSLNEREVIAELLRVKYGHVLVLKVLDCQTVPSLSALAPPGGNNKSPLPDLSPCDHAASLIADRDPVDTDSCCFNGSE